MFDDSIRDLLGFNARTLYEECTPSNNPVDILHLIIFSLNVILLKE